MSITWHPNVRICGHSGPFVAISKPAGLLSHPNREGSVATSAIVGAPYRMDESCYVLPNGEKLFLLNRLDSPTSGIVLLTPLAEVARRIRNLWRCRVVRKHYVALVKGKIVLPCTWRDKLQIARGIHVRARPGTLGDLTALTDIEPDRIVVWRGEVFSYVQLFPRTGRTHQLRFQCSQHRHPIVGDRSYGDFSLNRRIDAQHLYLHAQGLTIPLDGREYSFEDPVPWSKELRCVGTKQ